MTEEEIQRLEDIIRRAADQIAEFGADSVVILATSKVSDGTRASWSSRGNGYANI